MLIQKLLNKADKIITRDRVVACSRITLFFIVVTLLIATYIGHIDAEIFKKGDFIAFYSAGTIMSESGAFDSPALYDLDKQRLVQEQTGVIKPGEVHIPYLNPPTLAWLMIPFSKIPYVTALNVWRVMNILVAALSVIVITKHLKLDLKWWDSLTILLVSMPGFAVLFNGQITFLLIGLYGLSYMLLINNRHLSAGFVLGLGALKPQLFLFLPVVFFFQRRWAALAGFMAGIGFTIFASIILVGIDGITEYLKVFTSEIYMTGIQSLAYRMYSLPAFIRLFLPEANATYIAIATSLTLAVIIGYWSYKKTYKADIPTLFTVSILATLIAVPHLFHYDLSLLLIPFLVTYSWSREEARDYILARNFRLALFVIFITLWISLFLAEAFQFHFATLLIFYLLFLVLQK